MRLLIALVISVLLAVPAHALRMCPDGSYVSGGSCRMAPDGSYVSGDDDVRMAPDGSYTHLWAIADGARWLLCWRRRPT